MSKLVTVDIADMQVSADPEVELITHSLGSCIGLAIWDPVVRVGGMLHYMLSDSKIAPERALVTPAMFADTGVPALFRASYRLGASKKRMIVKVAGGAKLFKTNDAMDVGRHNYVMLRRILWRNKIFIDGEHVRDCISRTMRLSIGTGYVTVENRKMGRIAI